MKCPGAFEFISPYFSEKILTMSRDLPPLKELSLQSGKITYREAGSGKPLLLLHGWGVDSKAMAGPLLWLSAQRRCIALDFPGFGGSEPPSQAWTVDQYADWVRDVIQELELGNCDILAHSFGGRVTLSLLAADPRSIQFGKILITGGAGMKPRRSWKYYARKWTAKTLKAPFLLLPEPLRARGLHQLRQTALWKSLGSADYKTLEGVMREIFVKTVSHYQEGILPQIPHSVLLVWGTQDLSTPLYQGERLEKGIRNAALVKIENAGHYAFLDQPAVFKAVAEAFFKD